MVPPKYKTKQFHGPRWDPVLVHKGIHICMCPVECGAFTGDGLTKYIQPDANEKETQNFVEKHEFEIKKNLKIKVNQFQNQ